jgi:Tfp pilus assembly protein PilV
MRRAISLIELVFAIVIMGIAVMSLPLILTQVERSNEFSLQQEAILAAKTKIGDILSYEWDQNSYDATTQRALVVATASDANGDLNCSATTHARVGNVLSDYRRKCTTTAATTAANFVDANINDVDDFNAQNITLNADPDNAGTLDYIFRNTLQLQTAVNYAADNAVYANQSLNNFALNFAIHATTSNIKAISVTVSTGDQNITLRAFTCNIGENTLLPSRPYQ